MPTIRPATLGFTVALIATAFALLVAPSTAPSIETGPTSTIAGLAHPTEMGYNGVSPDEMGYN